MAKQNVPLVGGTFRLSVSPRTQRLSRSIARLNSPNDSGHVVNGQRSRSSAPVEVTTLTHNAAVSWFVRPTFVLPVMGRLVDASAMLSSIRLAVPARMFASRMRLALSDTERADLEVSVIEALPDVAREAIERAPVHPLHTDAPRGHNHRRRR